MFKYITPLIKVAIETGLIVPGLGQQKYVLKDIKIYLCFKSHEKRKSTLNVYLNKTLRHLRRKCFLKQ